MSMRNNIYCHDVQYLKDGQTRDGVQYLKDGQTRDGVQYLKDGQTRDGVQYLKDGQTRDGVQYLKDGQTRDGVQYLENGQSSDDAFKNCWKKDGHERYFSIEDLPHKLSIRENKDLVELISIMWYLTGMTETLLEQGTCHGSCFVQKTEKVSDNPCPCPECGGCGSKLWGKVTVSTALHVIKGGNDAQSCRVRLFYDSSDSRDKEKTLYALKSHSHDGYGDWCALVCATHDLELLDSLEEKLKEHWKLGHSLKRKYQDSQHNLVVIVSHPHGGPKRLSFGERKLKKNVREVRDDQDWCYYSYDAATCCGSSGGPVYVLGQWNDGFGYWFGHSHNHRGGDRNNLNCSTIGVESKFHMNE